MFQLQSDLGALLGHTAVFEGVGKLIALSDSHHELGLGEKPLCLHAIFFRRGRERGEVDVRREVLVARGFVGIRSDGVLAICH